MQEKTKNSSIYPWRILFTYLIAVFHFADYYQLHLKLGVVDGWYIAVEFFFIVSGCLLYENLSSYRQKYPSALRYTLHRYRKIYPVYVTCFLITFATRCIVYQMSLKQCLYAAVDSFWEFLGLQCIGLNRGWDYINPTAWYISVLFIGGFILYFCLLKWKDTFVDFIAPLIIMITFSYFYRAYRTLDVVTDTTGLYLNGALMRGLADMCLGIYACRFKDLCLKRCKQIKLLKLLSVPCYLCVIIGSLFGGRSTADFVFAVILTFCVAVSFCPTDSRAPSAPLIQKWAGLTLSIYLCHAMFVTYFIPLCFQNHKNDLKTEMLMLAVYLAAITLAAAFLNWFVKNVVLRLYDQCRACLIRPDDAE